MEAKPELLFGNLGQNFENFRRELALEDPRFSDFSPADVASALREFCDKPTQDIISAYLLGISKVQIGELFGKHFNEIDTIILVAAGEITRGLLSRDGITPREPQARRNY